MSKPNASQLLQRFAAAEQAFLNQEFLAPAVRDSEVNVRIAGIVMRMKIDPADFEGWGIFLPITHTAAILIREAKLAERRHYLGFTRATSLILCDRHAGIWRAVAAHAGDQRIHLNSAVPVRLVTGVGLFDTVRVGFDGVNGWFDQIDPRADSATAAWLRQSLGQNVAPTELQRKGLTAQQRLAYALKFFSRVEAKKVVRRDEIASQLSEALQHAGATLDGYVEHRDGFRVTYSIAGRRHVSSVNKDDLTVQVAGICLNGEDRKFDLTSLVGVMNESGAGYAVPVGEDGMTEEEYWAVHPPE